MTDAPACTVRQGGEDAKPTVFAYIARTSTKHLKHHPIGTAAAATVDRPEFAKETAKLVAEWIADGCTIERVPVEWVRKHLFTTEPYNPAAAIEAAPGKGGVKGESDG